MKKLITVSISVFAVAVVGPLDFAHAGPPPLRETRTPGDTNCDQKLDLSDAIFTLNYLFQGTAFPPCSLADSPELLTRISQQEAELNASKGEVARLQAEAASASSTLAACQSGLEAAESRIAELEVPGCTDPTADNYDVRANVEDGACRFPGCTNPLAINYDPNANADNGSCRFASDAPGRLHRYTIIPLPPLTIHVLESEGRGINNAGLIVGQSLFNVVWQPDGSVVPLANLNGGFEDVGVHDINDTGNMIGAANNYPVFWLADGQIEALPGGPGYALEINNQGVAIGFLNSPGPFQGVRWELDRTVTVLEAPPGTSRAAPVSLNNRGQTIGYAVDLSTRPDGTIAVPLIWEDSGAVRRLPILFPFSGGSPQDINDNGIVLGYETGLNSGNALFSIAVLWDSNQNDKLTEIAPDNGKLTGPARINNLGQILASEPQGWALYGDGLIVLLSDLFDGPNSWTNLYPTDINDAGAIVGTGTLDGIQRAFLMAPTDTFYAQH